jgi:two-component system NtrC family sensor kinase
LRVPLFKKNEKIGSLFFMRAPSHPFTHEEDDFLNRVAEAVSLALDRIQKLRESEELKEQWEATFNSMSDPVLLIDTSYDIIQANKKSDGHKRKCYQWLFDRKEPCVGCDRGRNFRMQSGADKESQFEVFSQSLLLDPEKPPVFVNLYHDITQQVKMESQILESAKMAELGTIGSSIAHELNNPLGGILSFTQLIKMDMSPLNVHYQDILEMEEGVQRCKEIVQNLLGFARSPTSDSIGSVNLREVCLRALKIVELQTKSQGIEVKLHFLGEEVHTQGHLNLLAQALKNLLQNSIEHLTEKRGQSSEVGLLELEIAKDPQQNFILLVKDNGLAEKNLTNPASLGVSVAIQILKDHHARLDFAISPEGNNIARITFTGKP